MSQGGQPAERLHAASLSVDVGDNCFMSTSGGLRGEGSKVSEPVNHSGSHLTRPPPLMDCVWMQLDSVTYDCAAACGGLVFSRNGPMVDGSGTLRGLSGERSQ